MKLLNFKFKILADNLLSSWNRIAKSCPFATFYHRTEWLKAIRHIEPRAQILGCFYKNNLIGGCIVLLKKNLNLKQARKPWATFYNGPIFLINLHPEIYSHAMILMIQHLINNYHAVKINFPPKFLLDNKLTSIPGLYEDYSFAIDISDTRILWKNIRSRARQRIRKAKRLGIRCANLMNPQDFYRLYRSTYERQGLSFNISPEKFSSFFTQILTSKDSNALVALTDDNAPAAALLIGFHNQRSYFLLAASDTRLRKTDAVSLLWWEALKYCSKRSKEVDLVGQATPAISRFKQSFKPVSLPFLTLQRYPAGFHKVQYKTLNLLKRLLQL